MSSSAVAPATAAATDRTRLMVTRQDPETRRYHRLGVLTCSPAGYAFQYDDAVRRDPSVRPLLGFGDTARVYRSRFLFPLFDERILDPRRPDRPRWLDSLGLAHDVHPMELLARSGGRRHGDRIELMQVPEPDENGGIDVLFLVHGVRHLTGADDVLSRLHVGQDVDLTPEPANPVNPDAVLVSSGGDAFGYVPDPLLEAVHAMPDPRLVVDHVNGPDVGHHMRCLLRLTGSAVTDVTGRQLSRAVIGRRG